MDQREAPSEKTIEKRFGVIALVIVLIGAGCLAYLAPKGPVSGTATAQRAGLAPIPTSPYLNTAPNVAYVGDETCAHCHAEIARTYRQHPMGKSISPVPGADPPANGVVFTVGDLVYSVLRQGGKVIHREERRDASGRTVATTEENVRFMLGSGQRGLAFLVSRDGGLFQSPITWYTKEGRWGLSPLFDKRNVHFARPITNGCLFCHASRIEVFADEKPTQFHGTAIGCESCHGPGELHAKKQEVVDGHDWTIVNPAHLEPASLRESVCEQCHLQGSGRKNLPGRTIFDFRPGLPFDAFVAVSYGLGDPISTRRAVGHVEQMRASLCYKESNGELGCISCHDPHRAPQKKERVSYYRVRCLECHADRGCSLPREPRLAQSPEDDCTACHMPQSPSSDFAHAAVTVHSVPRRLASPQSGLAVEAIKR